MIFGEKWRRDNGYNFRGWKMVYFRRVLDKLKLSWLISFTFVQDDYDDGVQTLIVKRRGQKTMEQWRWYNHDAHDKYYEMTGIISKKELYKYINRNAVKIYSMTME